MNVLIVGGTGGIGFGFVEHFLRHPETTQIYVTYRHPQPDDSLLKLARQHPDKIQAFQLDVTCADDWQLFATQLKVQTQDLHIVLYCVGFLHDQTYTPEKSLGQIDPDHLAQSFQINSIGGILLAKEILPFMRHHKGQRPTVGYRNVLGFISAKVGSIEDNRLGGWYSYRASKAALNMLIKTASIEYRRKSPETIVVSLHPGTTDTRLSQPFQQNVRPEKLFSVSKTVGLLWTVLNQLEPKDSGNFYAWDGTILPW